MELQPDKGGCFELTVDGEQIYSKLETGSFPKEDDILTALEQRLRS